MAEAKPPLTKRQQRVYDFIKTHIEEHGWPPTIREISKHMALSGTAGAGTDRQPRSQTGVFPREVVQPRRFLTTVRRTQQAQKSGIPGILTRVR